MVQNCIEKYSKGTKQESSFKFWRHLVTDVTLRNGLWSEIIILRENAMAAKSKAQQRRVDPISKNHPTKSDSASNGLATLHSQSPTGRTVEFWQLWCTDAHVLNYQAQIRSSQASNLCENQDMYWFWCSTCTTSNVLHHHHETTSRLPSPPWSPAAAAFACPM